MTKVASDAEAFTHVLGRLEGDVGGILKNIDEEMHVPFWSLMRLMFPVAEAIADLIHHHHSQSTAANLTAFLHDELGAKHALYKPVASTLTVMFRHSLMHQDVPRIIRSNGREVHWQIDVNGNHLAIAKQGNAIAIIFNPKTFYEDLLEMLRDAISKPWNGVARARYNEWLELDLDKKPKQTLAEKAAVVEISKL